MRTLGAIVATLLVLSGGARAQAPAVCDVPDYLRTADNPLGRVSASVHDRRKLDIVVIGTGSSALPGPDGAAKAYPARLQAALRERLPNIEVNVTADIKSRRSAADMVKDLEPILKGNQPSLLVWQTGTYEAMRGVDPGEFRGEIEEGVEKLRAAGVDALLVNMQYSPRTETMIALDPYAEAMRLASRELDVSLFDRLAIMRYWNDTGVFDLNASGKDPAMAQQVHDCLGRALASVVVDAGNLGAFEKKASR